MDLVRRGSMLDEGLEVMRRCGPATRCITGEHYRVEGVRFRPSPLQNPLPIWVAAVWPNRQPLRRAANWQGVVPLQCPASGARRGFRDRR